MKKDLSERLKTFIESQGLSVRKFEQSLGIPYGYVKNISSGISTERFMEICGKYPTLNGSWLLTGEGPMLKPSTANIVENTTNNGRITQTSGAESSTLDKALDEIAEQRKLVATSQGQIDRLLVIIEQMTKK